LDTSKRYRLKVREGREIRERVRILKELRRSQLEFALSHKIKGIEGSYNLLKVGGKEAFDLNINDRKNVDIVDIHIHNVLTTNPTPFCFYTVLHVQSHPIPAFGRKLSLSCIP